MKKRRFFPHLLIILFSTFFILPSAYVQNCYVQLDDASGFDVTPYLAELEEQACKIIEPFFDSTYADSFKVYSFGFYKSLKKYDTYTYPDAFVDVQNYVSQQSPYYLLIGRQTDYTGIYTDFFVDVKLPDGGWFPCISPEKSEAASDYVKYAISNFYSSNGSSTYLYAEAEKEGMKELQAYIDKAVNCCSSQKNLCECGDEEEKNVSLLKGKGFIEHSSSSPITFYPAGYYDELESAFEISITNDKGMSFQLTAETDKFLNLSGIDGSVKVHYFDEIPGNCEGFEDFLGGLDLRHGSGSAGLDYVEDIVLFNFNGNTRLFYKFSTPSTGPPSLTKPGQGGDKILPWLAAWVMRKAAAAGVGMILHVGINVALEKWINDYATWGEAWDNVDIDPYDLIVAGVDGAMGLNSILGSAVFDGLTAGIQYLLDTDTDQITFAGFFSIVEGDFIQSLKYGAMFGLLGNVADQALKIGKKYFPIIKNQLGEFTDLFISFAKSGKVMGKGRIKAWEEAFTRNLPASWRKNSDFLELFTKALDEKPKIDLHMRGHINNGNAVGCHLSSAIDNVNVRLRNPQPSGLPKYYPDGKLKKAAIDIKDSNANWVPKNPNSTFFPEGWDVAKILEEIAYLRSQPGNKVTDRIWRGAASDGTQIQVEYTGPLNDLTFSTVFPTN